MRPLEDTILLNDMLDYARRAMDAVDGRSREDLNTDAVLAGALEQAPGRLFGNATNCAKLSAYGDPRARH